MSGQNRYDSNNAQHTNPGALNASTDSVSIGGSGATSVAKLEDAASANGDAGVAIFAVRKATPGNTSDTDGDYEWFQISDGRLWTSTTVTALPATTKFSVDASAALEASSVTKASAGTFYKITGRIDSSAATDDYYLHIGNHASLPGDGAVTLLLAPIRLDHTSGTKTSFDVDVTGDTLTSGIAASTGITWWISTTEFTKTIAGAIASATLLYV